MNVIECDKKEGMYERKLVSVISFDFISLLVLTEASFAQTTLGFSEVTPKDAHSMGIGGTFRVFSDGYSSFFGNPAGFAGANNSLTLVDLSTWAYLAPTAENVKRVRNIIDGSATDTDISNYVSDWIISNNGLGAGFSLGGGWVSKKASFWCDSCVR